jgi:dienelactone hydrolase
LQAKYAVRLLQDDGVDAAYVAHPSLVDAEELAAIKRPLSIAAAGKLGYLTDLSVCSPILQSMTDNNYAETDSIFPTAKRHESEEILAKTGQPYQINLFSGVEHGFAVRADISKPIIRFAKEAAFTQAVAWFNQYL